MSNIRNFKKDIQFVISELVVECLTYDLLFPKKHETELSALLSDLVSLQDRLFLGINQAKRDKNIPIGQAMHTLRREFNLQVSAIIERLAKLGENL